MRSVTSSLIIGGLIIFGGFEAKADENYFMNYTCSTYGGNCTYEILKSTGSGNNYSINKVTTWTRNENSNNKLEDGRSTFWHDVNENKLYFTLLDENEDTIDDNNQLTVYNISTDTWSTETINTDSQDTDPRLITIPVSRSTEITTNTTSITSNDTDISTNASNITSNDTDIANLQSLFRTKSGSTTTTRIGTSTQNALEIGGETNPTTIDQEGISVGGSNLIKKTSTGDIHIGKNSFVIGDDVVNDAHPIWAEDETGSKIPLNISGSDLQINGVSVQGQITTNKNNINNLGEGVANSTALTVALTALPQASTDSKLSCGVGTGAYSSSYALGLGCASKVNERVDVNFGGSYVGGGSKDYGSGSLENVAAKAGFVFKLGKITKPVQLSMNNKNSIKEETLLSIKKENEEMKKVNSELIDRLEKLEFVLAKLKEALTF